MAKSGRYIVVFVTAMDNREHPVNDQVEIVDECADK